jgi:hypothetical protein
MEVSGVNDASETLNVTVEMGREDLRGVEEQARTQDQRSFPREGTVARGSQFLDCAFCVVHSLLGIRLVLALIAANSSDGSVKLIRAVTRPSCAPSRGIVPSPSAEGGYTLVVPILIALLVYVLVHAAVNGMLRMVAQRKTTI